MKSAGIVRRIDDLGRVVNPKEIRRTHGIKEGDPIEIFTDGRSIVLRRWQPETWSIDELKEALSAAAKDAGKGPSEYNVRGEN